MKDNNKLNNAYDNNRIIDNMVNDSNGNLDVIASVMYNIKTNNNFDNKVISIKNIPQGFNMVSVREKTNGVINRVNAMFNNNFNNNDNQLVEFNKDKDVFKNKYSLRGVMDILSNKKFLMVVVVLVFVFSCITVGKTFSLRNKVNDYEDVFTDIEEKNDMYVSVYKDESNLKDNVGNSAAFELVKCINSSIDVNNLPSGINSIIKEINQYYNKSNNYFAFKYKDIYTGFSVSYNENQNIFTASTIKAPKDIYIYEMASLGKINLDEELTYTASYYNTGTGILKDKPVNGKYSVRELVEYSIVYSDNAAHNMLMDKYGRSNMLLFWKDKGTKAIFTENSNWGVLNASDASIYMEELYNFYLNNNEYGLELLNNFFNAKTKFITSRNGYKVANKSGWSGSAIHDVAIVFADNPYIVVGLSNLGNTDEYGRYFNKVSDFAYRLHTEYWKYKMNMCSNIIQY